MRAVSPASIKSALGSIKSADGVKVAFEYLDRVQPHVPNFSMLTLKEFDSKYGIQSLMLCYFIVQAFEAEYARDLPVCDQQTLGKYWQSNQELYKFGAKASLDLMMEVMEIESSHQPNLLLAVVHLLKPFFESASHDKQAASAVVTTLFILKTVIDAVDSITND
jgi:hypothetical protein